MMVGLTVYEDFVSYDKGVYEHVAGGVVGGHAMKLIGYGHDEQDGSLYWILQNQWSESWGAKGFVNIKAGQIGIDSMALSCDPDIE
jgi:cathepsin B